MMSLDLYTDGMHPVLRQSEESGMKYGDGERKYLSCSARIRDIRNTTNTRGCDESLTTSLQEIADSVRQCLALQTSIQQMLVTLAHPSQRRLRTKSTSPTKRSVANPPRPQIEVRKCSTRKPRPLKDRRDLNRLLKQAEGKLCP